MLLIRHHNQPQTFLSPSSTRTPALRCSSRRLRHTKVHAAMFRVAANEAPPQQPALTHCRCYSEFDYNRVYLSKHLSKFVARSTIQLLVSVHDAAWDPDAYLRDLVAQAHSVPDSPADAGGSVLGPYSATTSEEWPNCWELECGYDLLSFSSYRVVLQEKLDPDTFKLYIMPSTRRLVLLHERKGGSAICRPGEGAGLQVFPGSVPELAVCQDITIRGSSVSFGLRKELGLSQLPASTTFPLSVTCTIMQGACMAPDAQGGGAADT